MHWLGSRDWLSSMPLHVDHAGDDRVIRELLASRKAAREARAARVAREAELVKAGVRMPRSVKFCDSNGRYSARYGRTLIGYFDSREAAVNARTAVVLARAIKHAIELEELAEQSLYLFRDVRACKKRKTHVRVPPPSSHDFLQVPPHASASRGIASRAASRR